MKTTFTYIIKRAALFGVAVVCIGSCTQSTAPPDASGSNVAMRTEPDYTVIHSSTQVALKNSAGGIDSLQVTSAAFVASNFALRNDLSDQQADQGLNEVFIRTPQFLLAFDASGRQYIGEAIIPAGSYARARYDIHPLQGRSDSLNTALGPLTPSLLAGAPSNSTVIIHGYIWQSGEKMPFIYTSNANAIGSVLFEQPLVVGAGLPIEVIIRLSTQKTFTDVTGLIMDPRDAKNAQTIQINVMTALKASVNNPGFVN